MYSKSNYEWEGRVILSPFQNVMGCYSLKGSKSSKLWVMGRATTVMVLKDGSVGMLHDWVTVGEDRMARKDYSATVAG